MNIDMSKEIAEAMQEVADEARELEYLRWFKQNADFGPSNSDIHKGIDAYYCKETGNDVPKNWRQE